jgi:hypothetical protein
MKLSDSRVRFHAAARLLMVLARAASLLAAERRPNFLFIYTDDHRWNAKREEIV